MPLEYFYTLPDRIEEHRLTWRIEPRLCEHVNCLRQKIDPLAEINEEILEARIARYLFDKLQQQQEDKQLQIHWRAFLTRRCEIVVIQLAHLSPSFFRDLVLMGTQVTIHPVKFFDNFDSQRSRIELGHNASNASVAASSIYREGKLVMISPTSFANQLKASSYAFRMVPQITFFSAQL